MKCTLLLALLLPGIACASSNLSDLFQATVRLRQIEEKRQLPSLQSASLEKSYAEAKEKREALLHSGFARWEQPLVQALTERRKIPTLPSEEIATFLAQAFPEPRRLSALEWSVLQEWFGQAAQALLTQAFAIKPLPHSIHPAAPVNVLWIVSPAGALLATEKDLYKQESSQLTSEGHQVKVLPLSAFTSLEEQAEELHHILIDEEFPSFVLVSALESSSLVLKTLDLYPSLRQDPRILAWLNLDGHLYGRRPEEHKAQRSPASSLPADRLLASTVTNLYLLHADALSRRPSLGPGFRILNCISGKGAANLRESLVEEGETWQVTEGSAISQLSAELSLLSGL